MFPLHGSSPLVFGGICRYFWMHQSIQLGNTINWFGGLLPKWRNEMKYFSRDWESTRTRSKSWKVKKAYKLKTPTTPATWVHALCCWAAWMSPYIHRQAGRSGGSYMPTWKAKESPKHSLTASCLVCEIHQQSLHPEDYQLQVECTNRNIPREKHLPVIKHNFWERVLLHTSYGLPTKYTCKQIHSHC